MMTEDKASVQLREPYPLIIFGAGASFDYLKISRFSTVDQSKLKQWQAPLTNNIFDVSRFGRIIGKYEDIKPLASAIINITDSEDSFDFEEYLTNLEKNFPDNNYKKIMALRFYLTELFGKISHHFYRHENNHRHLIYEIENRIGQACFVNYNYDTLLEKNINTIDLNREIDSYTQGPFKVIKYHGAFNWVYEPFVVPGKIDVYDYFTNNAKTLNNEVNSRNVYPLTRGNFDYASVDFNIHDYRKVREVEWDYFLPAVAIPIGTKGNHVCPKAHIDILEEELKRIDRILVIGWRAQDEHLIDLLKKNLTNDVKLTVVSSNSDNAGEIALKFKDIQQIKEEDIYVSEAEGYTNYMIKREYEKFLT